MLTLRLIRREARIAWPVAAVLALLAVLLTAIPLSWPPRFDRLAAGSFADRVTAAQEPGALLSVDTVTTKAIWLGTSPPGALDRGLDRIGATLRGTVTPPLAATLGTPQVRVSTEPAGATGPGVTTAYSGAPGISLVHARPDASSGPVEYVQGRAPDQPPPSKDSSAKRAPIEVAASEAVMNKVGLTLGQQFELKSKGWSAPMVLVGVFRTDHGARPLWQRFPMLVEPWVVPGMTGAELYAQLLTSAGGIEQTTDEAPLHVSWDLPVTVDRTGPAATPAGLAELRSGLAGLRSTGLDRLCGEQVVKDCTLLDHMVAGVTVTDRLTPELEAFAAQRGRTEQLQGFALAGLLAIVVATAVAAARLGARRRAGAFALQLSRGARLSGIAGRLLAEAAVAVGAGMAVGWVIGWALTPPGAGPGSPVPVLVAGVLVWCAPAAVLLASAGQARPVRRTRRIVLEALVLLLAGAGLFALRTRGTFAGSGIDLQLSLTPVLLAVVTVLLLLRLLPPVLLRATHWARRSRGLVPLVALARAGAHSGAAALALLVLVLATGYGVFGGMVTRTVADSRAQTAEWRTGGAAAALVGPRDRLSGDLSKIPTVGHRVTVNGVTAEITAQEDGTRTPGAQLVGLDAAALGAAEPSSPVARALLAADGADAPVERTGEGGSIPVLTALADPDLAARFPDAVFEVSAPGVGRSLVRVVGALPEEALRDPVLGPVLGSGPRTGPLLLLGGRSGQQLPAQNRHASAVLFYPVAGGPPLDPAAVRAGAAAQLAPGGDTWGSVEFRDPATELDLLRGDGLVRSVGLAFQVTTGIGLLLALGAFALDLLLSATERARTSSYLRTLGTGSRAVFGLQVLQLLPVLLAAAAGGTALGLLLPGALGPALRLRALTGGPFEPATHIDWTITVGLGLAVAVLVSAAAALEAAISRRRGLGAVLRLGEAL
ncbi:hypothetical protein [Streptomyces sp. CBMA156]|uniref:hypothetical protein n=1 Tax=Streptomyces sp. CBMA156 TaxID=1930280 RepID=UPI001661EB55|nr:hypothetical protein [Streptomyces sp. CBMA156]MBD0672442.1 hypothetical protein [Streptomyces sp. CBMA156]